MAKEDRFIAEAEITKLAEEIQAKRKKLNELRRSIPHEEVLDYSFIAHDGSEVKLSSLFGRQKEMILIHNMGKSCIYCTLWADGLNGFVDHFENRAAFVVVSPDDYVIQRQFALGRGWKFKMYSCKGTTFAEEMGFLIDGDHWPGVSAFVKSDSGVIYRVAHDFFGPGDDYCSLWHFFDLFPRGANGWQPKYSY